MSTSRSNHRKRIQNVNAGAVLPSAKTTSIGRVVNQKQALKGLTTRKFWFLWRFLVRRSRRILADMPRISFAMSVFVCISVLLCLWTVSIHRRQRVTDFPPRSFQIVESVEDRIRRTPGTSNGTRNESTPTNTNGSASSLYSDKSKIKVTADELFAQEQLKDSESYSIGMAEEFETKKCRAQYEWQLATYTTCNTLHEFDLSRLHDGVADERMPRDTIALATNNSISAFESEDERVRLIAHGYWRDVWLIKEKIPKKSNHGVAMKTLRLMHDYVPRNYDRHRRDALAMDRLTKSKYVADIYGYCGNSGLFEYSPGGNIVNALWPDNTQSLKKNITQVDKLIIATHAASAVADVHNIDREGTASIAHTDISPAQFLLIDGVYKLNDFNRARFIRWSRYKDEPCGYHVSKNPGRNRSPEEYRHARQTEKVDVYSLGNIYYMLLMSEWPFSDVDDDKEAQQLVKDGIRPSFYVNIWNSTDSVDQILKEAMIMCHEQAPEDRATATRVRNYLKEKLYKMRPNNTDLVWEDL